jgi:hypothetical protein
MDTIRNLFACSVAAIAAYFHPIEDIIMAILVVLAVNFILGLLSGILVNKEGFNFKKAFICIVEGMVYFALISFIFFVGDKIHNRAGALQCISAITYALLYFYGVNIFKNLHSLLPANTLIAFLYYVVSFAFVDKIPYLKEFLKIENKKV